MNNRDAVQRAFNFFALQFAHQLSCLPANGEHVAGDRARQTNRRESTIMQAITTRLNSFFVAVTALAVLSACDSAGIGGAAGDSDDIAEAIALLKPFEGIYNLPDDWNGVNGDEAFLQIGAPGTDGRADVAFYDYDDLDNCLPASPLVGELSKDLFSNRIFMDGLFMFNEAELTRTGSTLNIQFNDDADYDNDGSTTDRVTLSAPREGVSQITDLGAFCL
ncbi:MAG: hypothetical protein HKN42_10290 [Granulosicoccus sp.]|nr:hypothetical protein [Granulosicoccus sp.]